MAVIKSTVIYLERKSSYCKLHKWRENFPPSWQTRSITFQNPLFLYKNVKGRDIFNLWGRKFVPSKKSSSWSYLGSTTTTPISLKPHCYHSFHPRKTLALFDLTQWHIHVVFLCDTERDSFYASAYLGNLPRKSQLLHYFYELSFHAQLYRHSAS